MTTARTRTLPRQPSIVLWSPHLGEPVPDAGPDTVVVATAPGMVSDTSMIEFLAEAARVHRGPVGMRLIDPDGNLVHAGADSNGNLVGLGARDPEADLYRSDRTPARLAPPFAWVGAAPAIDLSGAMPTTLGTHLGERVARTARFWEEFATGSPFRPRAADLAPDAILVLVSDPGVGNQMIPPVTSAITARGLTPVVWLGYGAEPRTVEGLRFGPHLEAPALAHAFEPVAVIHLDPVLLDDSNQCEALLRAVGRAPVALLGDPADGSHPRAETVDPTEGLESWLNSLCGEARPATGSPSPTPLAPVDRTTGTVSVVIPVHGRWDLTERCLEALRATATVPLELIVVDDASPDDTRLHLVEQDDVTAVLLDENLGFPGAVNRGLAATTGEFVCILNNDTEVTPGWLEEMLEVLAIPGTGMVGPRSNRISGLQNVMDAPPLRRSRRAHHWARDWSEIHRGVSWRINRLVGFCLLARRELFESLGGLDEGFGRGNFEDDELCDRVLGAGGALRVADGAVVLHHGSATFAGLDDDYLDLLSRAARNWRGPRHPHGGGTAVVVLSDGAPEAAAATAWSALRLSDEIRVVERAGAHSTALAVARAAHLGVEVLAADWRRPEGSAAAFAELDSRTVLVLEAGETVSFGDLGPTRAALEAVDQPTSVDVGGSARVRLCPLGAGTTATDVPGALSGAPGPVVPWLAITPAPVAPPPSPTPTSGSQVDYATDDSADSSKPSTPDPTTSTGLRVVVLADSETLAPGLATAGAAGGIDAEPALLVMDSSPEVTEVDLGAALVNVERLDWTDRDLLRRRLEALSGDTALILQAGEYPVFDPDAWAGESCVLPPGPLGVSVGDRVETRVLPVSEAAVDVIGAATEIVTSALRIVAADLPGGPAMAALFPEIAAPSAVRAASAGFEPWTEKLSQTLALDEEQRILAQIRDQRPIRWDGPSPTVAVVIPVVDRHPDGETLGSLNATLAALLNQTHPDLRLTVVAPGPAHLHTDEEAIAVHHDLSVTPDQCRSEVLARLTDLGAALTDAEWICVVEPGLIPRSDHVELLLDAAHRERAEVISGSVAVEDGDSGWATRPVEDHLATSESVSGVLFHAELSAIGHHPGSWRLPEGPGRNRLQRLRVLGVREAFLSTVTMARPVTPPEAPGLVRVERRPPPPVAPTGVRLHLGCGPNKLPGWVNIDMEEKYEPDLLHDLSQGLPRADASVDLIFSEHFFEHLTLADGVALMAECHRVLRPRGVLRIAMPDLTTIVRAYLGDWRDQAWLAAYPQIRTAAQMLNTGMRAWDHRYLYDLEDLTLRLTDLGFTDVRPVEWGRSDHPELVGLETRDDSRLIVEATRP